MDVILQTVADLDPVILFGLLLLLTTLEYLFPPVPGDTTMLFASVLAGAHVLPPVATWVLMVAGSCLGGYLAYILGKKIGRPILNSILFRYLGHKHIARAEKVFHSHGSVVLCGNRFLPGIRGVMMPLAGIVSYPFKRALLTMALSNIAWCSFIFILGFWFGGNWHAAQQMFKQYNVILAVLFSLFILTRLWSYYRSSFR